MQHIARLVLILGLLALPAPVRALTPTPSPRPTATATPAPTLTAEDAQQRLADAAWLQLVGDCANARRTLALLLSTRPAAPIAAEANFRMGQCYYNDAAYTEAVVAFQDALQVAAASDPHRPATQFMLGEAFARAGAYEEAEAAFVAARPLLPAIAYLTWQRIAAQRRALDDLPGAVEALTAALPLAPDRTNTAAIRRGLAELALAQGDIPAAVTQYDALRGTATTGALAAEMQYLAGTALAQRGLVAAMATALAPAATPRSSPTPIPAPADAVARWRAALAADITSKWAHAAVVALLDAGEPVDEYTRGLANYYNGVHALAIAAFDRLRAADPAGANPLAGYYAGLAQLALGEVNAGAEELTAYISRQPTAAQAPAAQYALARALQRADRDDEAIAAYRAVAARWPAAAEAPQALYQAAALQAWLRPSAHAANAAAYVAMARQYPAADEAWRAFQAAGLLWFNTGDWRQAAAVWREMATLAGLPAFARPVANFWLGRALHAAGDAAGARAAWQAAVAGDAESFYGLRAAAWLAGQAEAWVREAAPRPAARPPTTGDDRATIAAWLRTWAGTGSLTLPAAVRGGGDWQRAQTLLSVGRRSEALVQLERLRQTHQKDAWTLAALALAFRDVGAHRLALLAAEGVVTLSGQAMHAAPSALQRLAYPLPYADLIRQEAARQELDPRLLAAIMRQESRFEAGVASVAGAQGLMQVMPGTAASIARQMAWPDFEPTHAYYPYVNVAFGAFYVRQWLSHFDGSVFAALAAYNGGPGNAGPWYSAAPDDEDLFAANINISETRVYVQAVWQNYEAYRRLYAW